MRLLTRGSKGVSTALATIVIISVLVLSMSWMAYTVLLNAQQQARAAERAETIALKAKELVRVYIWLDPARQPNGAYLNLTRISFVNEWSGETTINGLLTVYRDGQTNLKPVNIRLGAGEERTYLPSELGLAGLDNYDAFKARVRYVQAHTSLGNDFVSLWGRPDRQAVYEVGGTGTVTSTITETRTVTATVTTTPTTTTRTTATPPPPPPPPPPTTTTTYTVTTTVTSTTTTTVWNTVYGGTVTYTYTSYVGGTSTVTVTSTATRTLTVTTTPTVWTWTTSTGRVFSTSTSTSTVRTYTSTTITYSTVRTYTYTAITGTTVTAWDYVPVYHNRGARSYIRIIDYQAACPVDYPRYDLPVKEEYPPAGVEWLRPFIEGVAMAAALYGVAGLTKDRRRNVVLLIALTTLSVFWGFVATPLPASAQTTVTTTVTSTSWTTRTVTSTYTYSYTRWTTVTSTITGVVTRTTTVTTTTTQTQTAPTFTSTVTTYTTITIPYVTITYTTVTSTWTYSTTNTIAVYTTVTSTIRYTVTVTRTYTDCGCYASEWPPACLSPCSIFGCPCR